MIAVFIGPPFAGKDTQTKLLSDTLSLPVFSMGALIREAMETDKAIKKAYQKYAMQGMHLPNDIKFHLLKNEMDQAPQGFILDNYPATEEDLQILTQYMKERNKKIDKVFLIVLSEKEMKNRITRRGRKDDDLEIIKKRRLLQDEDRVPVVRYFKEKGILFPINGEDTIENVHLQILQILKL